MTVHRGGGGDPGVVGWDGFLQSERDGSTQPEFSPIGDRCFELTGGVSGSSKKEVGCWEMDRVEREGRRLRE